mmetsp:Transcript_732/g.687  ORF Transcript_732/g.687 Transcript_732/m.687 type:complete len:190 (+) Transcript_732:418-987(+)
MNIDGRSGKQCRDRWSNHLCPAVKKGDWTDEEDELIYTLHQRYGCSWSKIAKFVPNRTENTIKNRFYSTLRKITNDRMKAVKPRKYQRSATLFNTRLYNLLAEKTITVDEANNYNGFLIKETIKVKGDQYVILRDINTKDATATKEIRETQPACFEDSQSFEGFQQNECTSMFGNINNNEDDENCDGLQ